MKILVIRFSSIGDIILCTPIIRCVKKQINNCELHMLSSEKFSSVLKNNPFIDEFFNYGNDYNAQLEILKKEQYDVIIDLHKSKLSLSFAMRLSGKYLSFSKMNVRKFLFVYFKWNTLPDVHLVDRYFEGIKSLNVVNDDFGLDYFLSEEPVKEVLPEVYDVLILGAAHFTKRIPLPLAHKIILQSKRPIVLLGGNDVMEEGKELLHQNPNAINCVGKTTLNQSGLIIRNAGMIYTSDTGLMHMAAALKKPITIFWGNTMPAFGMSPYYGDKSRVASVSKEVDGLSCRPCSKLGFDKCPKGHFKCMMDQEP
jgi:ADP-heptose:LPS heptosyltransferase